MIDCRNSLVTASCILALFSVSSIAEETSSQQAKDDDYELEEVIITARQPEWRVNQQDDEWRPGRFELPEEESRASMEWLPEYSRDERDDYNEVRDRMNEKPDYKLFKWRF